MDQRDEQADERDRTADERDDAADENDQRDLAALFDEATSELDRKAVDDALSKIDWQPQMRGRERV